MSVESSRAAMAASDRAVSEFLATVDPSLSVYEKARLCWRNGFSQSSVARLLRLSRTTVQVWYKVGFSAHLSSDFRVADRLGVGVGVGGVGPRPIGADEVCPRPIGADEVGPRPIGADEVGLCPIGVAAVVPVVDVSDWPKSWQAKYERAVRDLHEHYARVAEEAAEELAKELVEDAFGPRLAEVRRIGKLLERQRGFIPRQSFRVLLACLSPDGRKSISDERLGAAFRLVKSLEAVLVMTDDEIRRMVREEEFNRQYGDLRAAKARRDAERKAARAARTGREVVRGCS